MRRLFLLIAITLVGVGAGTAPTPAHALTPTEERAIYAEIERLSELVAELTTQLAALKAADEQPLVSTRGLYQSQFYDQPFEAVYFVSDATLEPIAGHVMRTGDQLVFETFMRLVGTNFVDTYITEFRIFNDTDSYMGAFIERKDDDSWLLALNRFDEDLTKEYDSQFIVELLLHESAHIPFFTDQTYETDFIEEFWSRGSIVRHYERILEADLNTRNILGEHYYDRHQNDFVTDYAASSPTEDLVESFVEFVVSDTVPRGPALKHQKVRFFYGYPELIEWRTELRMSGLI